MVVALAYQFSLVCKPPQRDRHQVGPAQRGLREVVVICREVLFRRFQPDGKAGYGAAWRIVRGT